MAEKQKKLGKSQLDVAEKEELPELKVSPELLTSRSLAQPGAETAAGDTPHKDASSSNQQDAKPAGAEIVHGLKSAVTASKETPRAQATVHETQQVSGSVTNQDAELAALTEKQGTTPKASHAAFNAVAGTETTASVLSVPEPTGSAGVAEPAGKAVGASPANVQLEPG